MTASESAIRVQDLSKLYRIGKRQAGRTLREVLSDAVSTRVRGHDVPENTAFWALRDVSFEVKRGEVVGVIGKNGAGKSTLLKILSRITDPTSGFAEVHGRVGSLLEVGTGFHPELTGRENVYLNGAILGMKRSEIDRKFTEIVDFAEVERFIDTAVKHYSSGMYVRLAFAVAAHLEPEVLIVDEVLAVGDAAFQARCIEHFEDMRRRGKTILLISHNLGLVSKVCERAFLLHQGSLVASGPANEVVDSYSSLSPSRGQAMADLSERQSRDPLRWGNGLARIVAVCTISEGQEGHEFGAHQSIDVAIELETKAELDEVVLGLVINNSLGQPMFATNSEELGLDLGRLDPGNSYRAVFSISNSFGDGLYSITCAVRNRDRRLFCRLEDAHTFQISGRSSRSPLYPPHSLTFDTRSNG